MNKLKHVQLFEEFKPGALLLLPKEDKDAIAKILSVSNEPWFTQGEDAPEEFIDSLEGFHSDNSEIAHAVEICTGGPGFTDVWLERNELISDVMQEDPDVTEEEIEDSNRNWFASERASIIDNFSKFLK